jgi:Tfp pilus assembly protein PilN
MGVSRQVARAADDQLADWMAMHGGSLVEAAAALQIGFSTVQSRWARIRKALGDQAR